MDREIGEKNVLEFQTYEDYLDRQVTTEDLYYLDDIDHAREIVELGYKGKDFLTREEFEAAKKAATEGPLRHNRSLEVVCSVGKNFDDSPFLYALAKREELVRNGKLSTIIFIRDDVNGHEVSGYIDFGHRLKTEDFEPYFNRRKKLLPKRTDLSHYNWRTHTLYYNNTNTFQVVADNENGLLFKHKRDRKTINVDPKAETPGDNSNRTVIKTHEYTQVTLYDHVTRRKN
eukprot:Tbor_TRINITY_DN1250_c0_g2::TRINITY_DN1250_c0_g2_i1::g.5784::m.5784